MIKIIVETKSQSKRVFEVEDDELDSYAEEVLRAFKGGQSLHIEGVIFNTQNVTLVEFQSED